MSCIYSFILLLLLHVEGTIMEDNHCSTSMNKCRLTDSASSFSDSRDGIKHVLLSVSCVSTFRFPRVIFLVLQVDATSIGTMVSWTNLHYRSLRRMGHPLPFSVVGSRCLLTALSFYIVIPLIYFAACFYRTRSLTLQCTHFRIVYSRFPPSPYLLIRQNRDRRDVVSLPWCTSETYAGYTKPYACCDNHWVFGWARNYA